MSNDLKGGSGLPQTTSSTTATAEAPQASPLTPGSSSQATPSPAPQATSEPASLPSAAGPPGPSLAPQTSPTHAVPPPHDNAKRADLIAKARAFLTSPQVQAEDLLSKRRFLAEKGLRVEEIDTLLREAPAPVPTIPPRTYPQLPPSQLPNLLAGVARILSWVAGGSLAVLVIYFRYIYPRLDKSYQARIALRSHHQALLGKFTESISALKVQQADTHALLPRPEPFSESPQHAACHTLESILAMSQDEGRDIPTHILLRCAIEDLAKEQRRATTEEIFIALEARLKWLTEGEEGAAYEDTLWKAISNSPVFEQTETDVDGSKVIVWSYHAPTPLPLSPLLSSLSRLKSSLPERSDSNPLKARLRLARQNRFQHILETLSSLTGYISAQTYTLPSLRPFAVNSQLNSEEEEVRKEIRALKGLVLTRRSFMPAIPRPASAASLA